MMQHFLVPEGEPRRVRAKDGQRTYSVQWVGLVGRDGLASRFELWTSGDKSPYAPGRYVLDVDNSVYVNQQGKLAINPVLIPFATSKDKAA